MIVTTTSLKTYRACPRKFFLQYVQGWRSAVDVDVLRFGSLVHAGLEAWWRATDDRLTAALQAMAGTVEPYDLARAQVLLAGYDARWGGERFEVLGVEVPFEKKQRGRWTLAGKIDALARDERGDVWVVEHKTSSEDIGPGSAYRQRLTLDGQCSNYIDGARSLGFEPVGILYDAVKKPGLRVLQPNAKRTEPESPAEHQERVAAAVREDLAGYFQRWPVVRLAGELDAAREDVRNTVALIRKGLYPRNPDACFQYGRACQFHAVCSGAASLCEPEFRRTEVHPELNAERGGVNGHAA